MNLSAEKIRAMVQRPVTRDTPIRELMIRNGKNVWVRSGRRKKLMRQVTLSNGKGTAQVEQNKEPLSVILYDTALTQSAYGYGHITPQLGDLFNDVMGAVVPGWDKRPDWMKKIQVKPDPAKLVQAASKVVPPHQVQRVLEVGQQYGITPYYAGQAITPGAGYGVWTGAGAGAALAQVPGWVWLAGGGVVLVLVMGMRR